jgi:hypothetical protein
MNMFVWLLIGFIGSFGIVVVVCRQLDLDITYGRLLFGIMALSFGGPITLGLLFVYAFFVCLAKVAKLPLWAKVTELPLWSKPLFKKDR